MESVSSASCLSISACIESRAAALPRCVSPVPAHQAMRRIRMRERRQQPAVAQQVRVGDRRFDRFRADDLLERAPLGDRPCARVDRWSRSAPAAAPRRCPRRARRACARHRCIAKTHGFIASPRRRCIPAPSRRAHRRRRGTAPCGATSSGRTLSGSTWLRLISSSPSGVSHLSICRSVMIQPGVITLMRMRCSPSSAASPRVRPMTDDLAVVYTGHVAALGAVGIRAEIDDRAAAHLLHAGHDGLDGEERRALVHRDARVVVLRASLP